MLPIELASHIMGLGTIINVLAIIVAGFLGLIVRGGLKERYQESLLQAIAACVMFVGIAGALSNMFVIKEYTISVQGTLMMIITFAVGTIIGEVINIEGLLERFGNWLRRKTNSQGDNQFLEGFLTASLTVCIGAMAVVGAIQDALVYDVSILTAKACLDFVIILIMTASMGKGCIFSAVSVGVFQGAITLLASLLEPIMTEQVINNITLTGYIMIFLVGVNLLFTMKIRIANMLPTLIIAALWALYIH